MPPLEETEAEDFGVGLSITQSEVTEVLNEPLGSKRQELMKSAQSTLSLCMLWQCLS